MTGKLEEEGHVQEAVLYSKVYGTVLEFFDDTHKMIGDERVSMKDFVNLIETGLTGIKFSETPPSLDQIIVGDISRTRFRENNYVFVLGVNEGKVPLVVNSNQLLTDRERTSLHEIGLDVAPTQRKSLFKEQLNIYNAFTKGTKLLHLSFTRLGEEGVMRPAPIFFTMLKMFPKCKVEYAEEVILEITRLTKNKPMFSRLTNYLSSSSYEKHEGEIQDYYRYFNERYQNVNSMTDPRVFIDGLNYDNRVTSIDDMKVSKYHLSVSELENFAGCTYAHFLNYRLELQERQEFVVTLPDIGVLFHKCLELYIKKCVVRKLDMSEMEPQLRNQLVDECIDEMLKSDRYKVFSSSYKNRYLVIKLTRIVKRALWGIENQLKKSLLKPKEIEYNFDGEKQDIDSLVLKIAPNMKMFMNGVVDRVDEYETENDLYISIIDYKSSHKKLEFGLIDSGIQLQLFVYLNVVKEIKEHNTTKKVTPTGLYYYQIQDPFVKNETFSDDDMDDKLLGNLRPSGLVLHDENIIRMLDCDIQGASKIIPVSLSNRGIGSRSSTITEEAMNKTLDFVGEKARKLGAKIYKGHIHINPYSYEGKTACDYCQFKSVCRFDPTNKPENFHEIKKRSMEDIVSQWEGDSSGRSHKTDY
jgi:ATP-dependent helicase/nuclease subunit B